MRFCTFNLLQEDLCYFQDKWNSQYREAEDGSFLHSGKPEELFFHPEKTGNTDLPFDLFEILHIIYVNLLFFLLTYILNVIILHHQGN